jgi:cellulose biosynthesis protein BcsQ
MLSSLLEWLKDFANTYGTLVNILFGGLGFVATAFFGGKFFYSLVQKRVTQLEKELDEKIDELRQCRDELATSQKALSKANAAIELLNSKLLLISTAFDGPSDNLWLRDPVIPPRDYGIRLPNSIPIVLIANLKGGVGKTTLAANLAAYFEVKHSERVLGIDLDYQGSLSSMLLPEEANRNSREALCLKKLIGGTAAENSVLAYSKQMRGSKLGSRILECDDPFANFETRLLIEWLTGDVVGDIRYNLARSLCSDEVQREFDRIIIDAPPRLTTGFINALCASTHLVVPFVLDLLSAERVGLFLNSVKQMRGQLFPHLSLQQLGR